MDARILTTIWDETDERWNAKTDLVDRRNRPLVWFLMDVWKRSQSYEVLILNGAIGAAEKYSDLLAAIVARLHVKRRPTIVITDCTWQPGSRAIARMLHRQGRAFVNLSRSLIRIFDSKGVHYCVLSNEEQQRFPENWRIANDRVHTTLFPHTTFVTPVKSPQFSKYVFAGGNSLRDYGPLIAAAAELPNVSFFIATRLPPPVDPLPSNVEFRPVGADEFRNRAAGAGICIVPTAIDSHRSAGQQTILNAMFSGVPVIATRSIGIDDYVSDQVDGLMVDNNCDALVDAISWVLSPENKATLEQMLMTAYQKVLVKHTPDSYRARLVDIAEEATQQTRVGPTAASR